MICMYTLRYFVSKGKQVTAKSWNIFYQKSLWHVFLLFIYLFIWLCRVLVARNLYGMYFYYLFIWLCRVLVAAQGIFHCGAQAFLVVAHGLQSMQAQQLQCASLVALRHVGSWFPDQGLSPRSFIGRWILNHWTAKKVLEIYIYVYIYIYIFLSLRCLLDNGQLFIYQFSRAAVTIHHKLSGLKQHKLLSYSFGGQMSKVGLTELKSRHQQGCVPSGASRGGSISSLPLGSRHCLHSLACGPFLHFLFISLFFLIFKFYFIYFFIQQVLISHQFYTHQCIHVNPNHPIHHTTIPTLPRLSPLGVHTFVLYICVSTSALQTGSSVPFFQVPHICVNIRYLFFSF